MYRLWWQLPGPHRFVDWIVQDLRAGKNVVIALPQYGVDGLASSVRTGLGDGGWVWQTIDARECKAQPTQFLFSRFVTGGAPDLIRNVGALLREDSFAGRVIWLDGLSVDTWLAWKSFLNEYAHACRSVEMVDRTVFCVPLVGILALDPPREEICLSQHRWLGIVSSLDMLLFTANIVYQPGMSALQQRLAVSVIANLALWDPSVSERFSRESIRRILEPTAILQEIGRERGWHELGEVLHKEWWCRGVTNTIDEEERSHSAFLSHDDVDRELTRRVWSAEVGVMLPFVEERRQDILSRLAGVLKVPYTTRYGDVINDLRDLEIGHIENQLVANNIRVGRDLWQLVRRLREIRNCLSHLEVVTPDLLLSDEIGRSLESTNNGRFLRNAPSRTGASLSPVR